MNYRIHDPDPAGSAASYLPAILTGANTSKADQAIRQAAGEHFTPAQPEDAALSA